MQFYSPDGLNNTRKPPANNFKIGSNGMRSSYDPSGKDINPLKNGLRESANYMASPILAKSIISNSNNILDIYNKRDASREPKIRWAEYQDNERIHLPYT